KGQVRFEGTLGTPFYLMEHCAGRVCGDGSLPTLQPSQRRAVYAAMSQVLAKIHRVDLRAAELEDLGEHGSYIQREVEAWTKQYRATETHVIPAMERLIEWLPLHFPESQKTTVVHGDFRMDNLVFHPDRPEVLAVLGWKLSTLGDPISDLANNCMAYFLPPHFNALRGLRKCDLGHLGIPTAEEYSQMYCDHMGTEHPENWNFYMAFAFFRLAAMLQGLYRHSLAGEGPNLLSLFCTGPQPERSCSSTGVGRVLGLSRGVQTGSTCCRGQPQVTAARRMQSSWPTWAGSLPSKKDSVCSTASPPQSPWHDVTVPGPGEGRSFLSRSCAAWPRPGAAPVPKVPTVIPPTSLLGMAQGLYCKLEKIVALQWGFLISQPRWTPRPPLEAKVRHLPLYTCFAAPAAGWGLVACL
uniref:Aminoglycoside phosphotransferase domain-containing protein n=1 Tax=Athene cunicularia TaxID=194338 RepID=A0A663MLJ6_ATHCN